MKPKRMVNIDSKNMTIARAADIMENVMNVMICNYKLEKIAYRYNS